MNIFFKTSSLGALTFFDATMETVKPTSVTIAPCPASNITVGTNTLCATFTGNFVSTHGQMIPVKSGTLGLQEAINAATATGGRVNRILGSDEELTGPLEKSLRQAKRQREQ